MTKDASGRSSATASNSSPSPREDGDENAAQESMSPGEGSAGIPQAPPSALESSQLADATPTDMRTAESQPMTASNSTSSILSAKEAPVNGAGAAVPYGTRSRNRTGTSRPNYAEDKELDAEFDAPSSSKEANGRKVGRVGDASNAVDTARLTTPARKIPVPEAEHTLTIQSHYREPIPGTSTFSANPAATGPSHHSKKRKATSQTTPLQPQPQILASHLATPQAVTRRASLAAHVLTGFRDSNMLSFDDCAGRLSGKRLVADDGTVLEVNDHVYLVCEPPGEPYYLGRIMEFLHISNDSSQPIDALRLNWYYRPKDIGRKVNDTRQVFASMHSDISPLTALRGKCEIKHKSEVDKLDNLRKTKDCFWYEKLYDRYIHRFYDVIPTSQVINVPVEVKKVLDERWKYIVVEPGRGKELTSAVKSCKRCNKYCASNDSVDCAVCHNTYHMSCVNPPLLKKPSRGFAWACGPCSKAQEKKLEARNTPNVTDPMVDAEEEEYVDGEGDSPENPGDAFDTGRTSPTISSETEISFHPGTAEQIHQASLWLFRYLGIHCKVEDALDYDDRIYPRASSRLGPRHQANVPNWPGRPVEYIKPAEIKRKYMKGGGHKKVAQLSKDTIAALEAEKAAREKRPKWVMDEPPGYVHRGEDYDNDDPNNTARLLYKLPEADQIPAADSNSGSLSLSEEARERLVYDYIGRAAKLARPLGLPDLSTNLLDVALQILLSNGYDAEKSLEELSKADKKIFKEPDLSGPEVKKFEDGVAKYGSEWHSIKKHVKTVSPANIVRFYYTWKKTERGKQVWGNYSGRKGKKEAKRAEASAGKLQDDVADEYDDSAFDNDKAFEKKRGFQCKFCSTRNSRQWRRAPNTAAGTMVPENPAVKTSGKDKGPQLMVALCRRCAELWRRYAIQWEDIDEVTKKVAQAGGRAWKRKIDEELLKELVAANDIVDITANLAPTASVSADGSPAPLPNPATGVEPPKKKIKGSFDRDITDSAAESGSAITSGQKKKATSEKPAGPPPAPEVPKPKMLPCAICGELEPMGDQHLSCKECRMTVHRNCYGVIGENRSPSKWVCDMCFNDKNPQVSIQYKCMLCPVEHTEHDFVEPPKVSHKKKTEKDRERDRVDREAAQKVADYYRKKQEEMNKPVNPREPLKRTANNNWVHVTCAVFTPEVKFGSAKALAPSEGIPSIASARYDEVCKVCKQKNGACVGCHSCKAPVHVACAHQAGYILGFDIAPVKGSRRDQFSIVNIDGEIGTMTAAIWCKEHVPTKTIVHRMHDIVDASSGLNALQLYVQNFKQADLTLTGTVRKATLVNQSTKVVNPVVTPTAANRRTSTTSGVNGNGIGRGSISHIKVEEAAGEPASVTRGDHEKTCVTCQVSVSPKWWPFPQDVPDEHTTDSSTGTTVTNGDQHPNEMPLTNGHVAGNDEVVGGHIALAAAALTQNGNTLQPLIEPKEFQCHKCHWKKIRKEPTPPPPAPRRESPRPVVREPPAPINISTTDPDMVQQLPSPFAWPPPPAYTSNGYNWSRQSPAPQGVISHQLNTAHSSHISAVSQQMNGQPHMRQPPHNLPRSPHQNGHLAQIPNGYPPSPHRGMGSSAVHLQNGAYGSYVSTRPPPQHLTNGGPPPRAPEHPFSHSSTTMHPRASFGPPQSSPPILRDSRPPSRDIGSSHSAGPRPPDGRVNGGASASPSLRNLLS
ncbi:hypothetical protein L207DRAFT_640895 [Hyaloscypha variabilis F]|uniref:BAH-domain-containing protein n=1 Tax=Hyaloscypha variabilis (strain UAMH 11265 / GT02V1 / F) TaxID=1149755 RepID=A0A2J6QY21_HYAVF|nr:hypothetical protein L207DRAFT_640895 [Hyaloscypha variabilis F]